MIVTRDIQQTRQARGKLESLALVPTMGALHEGHRSLMRTARRHARHVAVSIFVNPAQFAAHEDLAKYPRPLEADLEACRAEGVDLVFVPTAGEMYPPGHCDMVVDVPALSSVLEGRYRPGHFRGVLRVVAKLFHIFSPQYACFGQKDFQQLRVIWAMCQALDFPIEIIACPIVREPDGLALSSRNMYLSPDERRRALSLSAALRRAESLYADGARQTNRLIAAMQQTLLEPNGLGHVPMAIDYVAAVDVAALHPIELITGPTALLLACRVGPTRLIDNTVLQSLDGTASTQPMM